MSQSKGFTKQVILTLDASVLADFNFLSTTDCPIARAAKKHFGKQVGVSTTWLTVYSGEPYTSDIIAHYQIFGDCGRHGYISNAKDKQLTVPVILNRIS